MKEKHAGLVNSKIRNASNGQKLLDKLYEHPMLTIGKAAELLEISYPTANTLVNQFCELGILGNPSQQRNKKFSYKEYIDILQEGTELSVLKR